MTGSGMEYLISVEAHPSWCRNCQGTIPRGQMFCGPDCHREYEALNDDSDAAPVIAATGARGTECATDGEDLAGGGNVSEKCANPSGWMITRG